MRLVVLFLFALFVLGSAFDLKIKKWNVPDCDPHCSRPFKLKMCCSGKGYRWDGDCSLGTVSCYSDWMTSKTERRKKIPTTETPTIEMSTTKPELTNEKIIHDLRTKILRLEAEQKSSLSKVEKFREELNVCKSDHEKYVESMARTKAIIEGIIAGKN